jgi:hypothetical protein
MKTQRAYCVGQGDVFRQHMTIDIHEPRNAPTPLQSIFRLDVALPSSVWTRSTMSEAGLDPRRCMQGLQALSKSPGRS